MAKKLIILVIIPGGVGSGKNDGIPVLLNLFEGLGNQVDLHVLSVSQTNTPFNPPSYTLHTLGLSNVAPIIQKLKHFSRFIKQLKIKPDLVHAIWTHPHGLMAFMASRYFRVPMINSLQGGCLADIPSIPYGGNQGFIKKNLSRFILRKAHAITAETQFQKNLIPSDLRDKASIIYYGIHKQTSTKSFEPIQINNSIKIIHVANLTPIKDQETLLKVIHKLSMNYDVKLTIIGSDYYQGHIHKLVDTLGLNHQVNFLGQLTHKEVLNQLRKHDFMLHTSLHEGSSLAIIEAWSVGLCTIGTAVGMMYDMADTLALVAPLKDVDGLVRQVEYFMENPSVQQRFSEACIAWTQANTMDDCVKQFTNLYKKLVVRK